MRRPEADSCRAWRLLVKFFFAQRDQLPPDVDVDLSPAQWHVLHLIEPDEPLPMGRLAETMACDASNITGLVDRLEQRGLVRRQPASHDRRVKVIELTVLGARLRSQLLRRMTGGSCSLSRLTPAQQRALVTILETLVER